MSYKNKKTITIQVPTPAELEQRRQQLQDEANALLEKDSVFERCYRQLRGQFTAGAIPRRLFDHIIKWQMGDCFRRANVPLNVARQYIRLLTTSNI